MKDLKEIKQMLDDLGCRVYPSLPSQKNLGAAMGKAYVWTLTNDHEDEHMRYYLYFESFDALCFYVCEAFNAEHMFKDL